MSASVTAEPWVKPDDYGLRADIQQLADAGVILAPVTTYPLMWKSFIADIDNAGLEQLQPPALGQPTHKNLSFLRPTPTLAITLRRR